MSDAGEPQPDSALEPSTVEQPSASEPSVSLPADDAVSAESASASPPHSPSDAPPDSASTEVEQSSEPPSAEPPIASESAVQPADDAAVDDSADPEEPAELPPPEEDLALSSSSPPHPSDPPVALSAPPLPSVSPPPIPSEVLLHVSVRSATSPTPTLLPVLLTRPYLAQRRAYLGGYRHHVSGRVKLHAETQTERRKTRGQADKSERSTQTVLTFERSAQSGREVGTQMDKKGEWLGDDHDGSVVEICPRDAVPSEVLEAQREANAKRIQCWLRVCFSRRRMLQLKADKDAQLSRQHDEEKTNSQRKEDEQAKQIHRRMHPRTKADFDLLYQELQAWREHESNRITALSDTPEEREKALSILLSKEVKLLQTIDRLRIVAAKQTKAQRTNTRLSQMQSPLEWKTSAGTRVEIISPHTVRAMELVSLYHALALPVVIDGAKTGCVDWVGRVDILLNVKYVVQECAGPLADEMVTLIEREQEWMKRRQGTATWKSAEAMDGLRQRLCGLFLEFVQTPQYNPQAALYVDSVGREGKAAMQQMLSRPLPDREAGKAVPSRGQETVLIGNVRE